MIKLVTDGRDESVELGEERDQVLVTVLTHEFHRLRGCGRHLSLAHVESRRDVLQLEGEIVRVSIDP